jgi:hypothetical protein
MKHFLSVWWYKRDCECVEDHILHTLLSLILIAVCVLREETQTVDMAISTEVICETHFVLVCE